MEHLENGLFGFAAFLKLILESISVLCILLGLLQALRSLWGNIPQMRKLTSSIAFTDLRIGFGSWLLLALEFQLAADIVNTTVAPSFEALMKLGAIAVVRTFLNYFLNKELTETLERKKELLTAKTADGDRDSE
ncbi:MAG TPA: DUF1622 domain-containing protein [Chroococcidiopsis sp.]